MPKGKIPEDLVGKKFGSLTVICQAGRDKHNKIHWMCKCDCGGSATPSSQALKSGNTKSCGCRKVEATKALRTTHAMSGSPEYRNWCAMKERCFSLNHKNYADYGGRGITVCERWRKSFEAFLSDMGPRPFPRATVERKDTNGNYEPDNCRWASQREQTRNKRNNALLTIDGETLTIAEWSERHGVKSRVIWSRIHRDGWSPKDAVTLPRRHGWSRRKKQNT